MSRPPCKFEREAGPEYTCGHDHCPRCGEHKVYQAPGDGEYRCRIEGTCQLRLGEFA